MHSPHRQMLSWQITASAAKSLQPGSVEFGGLDCARAGFTARSGINWMNIILSNLQAQVQANLNGVRQRISAACTRTGRTLNEVQLVAVTKYATLEAVTALVQCGHAMLGENRPQQLIARAASLASVGAIPAGASAKLRWHLIGPLQSNKIRSVLPWTAMIHSIESIGQLQRVSRIADELGLTPEVLIQVNVSGETTKGGISPSQLRMEWPQFCLIRQVKLSGLMTMAPLTDDSAVIRHTFRGLRELRDELHERSPATGLTELSMGMSHDFEIAIEEGATLVRIGSLLFEGCPTT